jgi:hypothetical protein
VFLVGREEMAVYAHRIILMARWVESRFDPQINFVRT